MSNFKIFEKYTENGRLFIKIFGIKIISHRLNKKRKNNYIVLIKNNGEKIYNPKTEGLNVIFKGNNNILKLYEPQPAYANTNITMYDKNIIEIKCSNQSINNLSVDCIYQSRLNIGENFFISNGHFIIDYNTSLNIGNDCMFSNGIIIKTSDGHILYDKNKNELILPKSVNIGNHVWVGAQSAILKGVNIPDGCVVGFRSLVTKSFDVPNSIIAGVPAKVVKTDICWDKDLYWRMKKLKNEQSYIDKFINI